MEKREEGCCTLAISLQNFEDMYDYAIQYKLYSRTLVVRHYLTGNKIMFYATVHHTTKPLQYNKGPYSRVYFLKKCSWAMLFYYIVMAYLISVHSLEHLIANKNPFCYHCA